ncbi:aldo-keto reductase family 1 member A1-B, partial [Nilaparvata lugens]|uniref:aldo-keto reductase family 1 member A1-B n=1 Tax=Nilaparvata lugens TaxID=108931 RepID=UPI00193D0657
MAFKSLFRVMDKISLSSGYSMPVLGLGTWQATPEVVRDAVLSALEIGYRHIDTAYNYKNEAAIGEALQEWLKQEGNRREDIFITTKLPHYANRPSDVAVYLQKSLNDLGLSYVDLYLVHMPFTMKANEAGDAPALAEDGTVLLEQSDHLAVWREMEKQVSEGRVHSIGISNFNQRQVERLCNEASVAPACLQLEMHAALQQQQMRDVCVSKNIALTAFSPLGSPGSKQHFKSKYQLEFTCPDLLSNETVLQLSKKHQRSPAQILLRHLVQLGAAVIPKSTSPLRLKENFEIFNFNLSDDEMSEMEKLDIGHKGRIINFLFFKGQVPHILSIIIFSSTYCLKYLLY